MSFNTISAPRINANDMEMIVTYWSVKPWEFVKEGDEICDVETTKAAVTIESEYKGYVYPLVEESSTVKVGEPLAHVFENPDHKQLDNLKRHRTIKHDVTVSKKALSLMKEFEIQISDFPEYTTISSETVIAKIREINKEKKLNGENNNHKILENLRINRNSIVISGEPNQSLLALDAFASNRKFQPIAYINPMYKNHEFYGLPLVHRSSLENLKKRGLQHIYICGPSLFDKSEQKEKCDTIGVEVISAIHDTASVSAYAKLGTGVLIGANASIGPDVEIGDFSQILCGATVAHHNKVGKFVNISDGTSIGGNVTIGDNSLVGIGVRNNKRINIGKNVTVVSGATVTDHIAENHIFRLDQSVIQKRTT